MYSPPTPSLTVTRCVCCCVVEQCTLCDAAVSTLLQLAKEILYDIKQAELAKQQHNKAAAQGAPTAAAAGEHQPDEAEPAAAAAAATGRSGVAGRASPPPAGVLPGTPVAAEVLKTAERQRRLKQQQQQQGAAGEMPPPSPRAPAAGEWLCWVQKYCMLGCPLMGCFVKAGLSSSSREQPVRCHLRHHGRQPQGTGA